QCERQQIAAHILLGHFVKPHQDQRVSEKDRVVEKSLGQHQHKTQNRAASMLMYDGVPNFMPRRMRACSNPGEPRAIVAAVADRGSLRSKNLSLDVINDLFRFIVAPMNHQPTRTLRNPASKENHNETERRADSKSETPSKPDWYSTRIEQNKRGGCTERSADPVRAVDDQIDAAAYACRNQLVNCGIDR